MEPFARVEEMAFEYQVKIGEFVVERFGNKGERLDAETVAKRINELHEARVGMLLELNSALQSACLKHRNDLAVLEEKMTAARRAFSVLRDL